jgi:FdhD protein
MPERRPTAAADLSTRVATGGRPSERVPVLRFRDGGARGSSDLVAGEEPLEVRLEGEQVAVTMRTPTPGQDAELAVGFLVGEAIIEPGQVARVSECRADEGDGGIADVHLWPGAQPAAGWQRNFYATSSCGICGKAGIDAVRSAAGPVPDGPELPAELLPALSAALRSAQRVFDRTGGLHAAGVFDRSGKLLIAREDVGRHNAVDKALGRAAMDGLLPLSEHLLLVSGRASFEIVQKALLAGVPIVAAVSAPSTLAIQLAKESNMTLVGFLRDEGFNVYAGAARVSGAVSDSGPA